MMEREERLHRARMRRGQLYCRVPEGADHASQFRPEPLYLLREIFFPTPAQSYSNVLPPIRAALKPNSLNAAK